MEVLNQILGKGLITPKVSCEVLDTLDTSDVRHCGNKPLNGNQLLFYRWLIFCWFVAPTPTDTI